MPFRLNAHMDKAERASSRFAIPIGLPRRNVYYNKRAGKWHARQNLPRVGGKKKTRYIGAFSTFDDAAAAWDAACGGPPQARDFAVVSEEDYEYVRGFTWHLASFGYACRAVRAADGSLEKFFMHREVASRAGASIEGLQVDHIDHDPLNNSRANVRPATASQNQQNTKRRAGNTSGHKGIRKRFGKYQAAIALGGRKAWTKTFLSLEEAIAERARMAKVYHGEFACTE